MTYSEANPLTRAPGPRRPWTGAQASRKFAAAATAGLAALALLTSFAFAGAPTSSVAAASVVYGVGAVLALRSMRRTYAFPAPGLCNLVTLTRFVLVAALVVPVLAPADWAWTVFAIAAVSLSLDGVDGWLARREGLASDFGARFDMEVDSLLALVLALNAWASGTAGALVLILGLPRYLFAAAGLVLPWLGGALPDRFSRKAVCVLQIAALIALQLPFVVPPASQILVAVTALALVWSFGRDILWLWRTRA
jgi:phosphatidylglycerophosphate synthase